MNESIRIYLTGTCEGHDRLREALATHPDLDFVGWSEHVAEATAALAGGHLQVVIHATGDTTLPAGKRGGRLGDVLAPADEVELGMVGERVAKPVETLARARHVDPNAFTCRGVKSGH